MEKNLESKQKFTVLGQTAPFSFPGEGKSKEKPADSWQNHFLSEDQIEAIEDHQVRASVLLLNKYVRRVQKIAISAITPLYTEDKSGKPLGLKIRVEGPARQLRVFSQLLEEANLKIG